MTTVSHKPPGTLGLRHLALQVKNLEACEHFYTKLLGMQLVWRPDSDNIYLSSGTDNLALHRAALNFEPSRHQHLDHLGFFVKEKTEVDAWHDYLSAEGVTIQAKPKDHRDGTRSFYCVDPDGNVVQLIWIPEMDPSLRSG
ncbi:MAG TPA: VOC family protein [Gammaproteobacteria bacterium]|nr:VOC family protein [Gammaproteobacteria bacterium]